MSQKIKYSRDARKHIVESIENLKNNDDYIAIFDIISEDETNIYTHNSNGVYLNLSTVSDKTLDKINKYLQKISKTKPSEIDMNVDVIPTSNNRKNNRTYKFSNYEMNILKQQELRRVLNNENKYEVMNFVSKPKTL